MEPPQSIRNYLKKIGRKGGLKGGKARWKGVTPEERTRLARKAVLSRWKPRTKSKPRRLKGNS